MGEATHVQDMTAPLWRVFYQIVDYLPTVVAAIALLLLGWLIASVLRVVCLRVSKFMLKRIGQTAMVKNWLGPRTVYASLPAILSKVVFWIVLIFFVAAAIESLGLSAVSAVLSGVTAYLPRVLVAAIFVFGGISLGDLALGWSAAAASQGGLA